MEKKYIDSAVDVTLVAGYDVRHGLIGPGVYASHGYERSHVDGVKKNAELPRHLPGEFFHENHLCF